MLRKRKRSICAGKLILPFKPTRAPLRAFWQARFYDFNVYTTGEKPEKLHYMHANPVVRGLVRHPKEWPWRSWDYFLAAFAAIRARNCFSF